MSSSGSSSSSPTKPSWQQQQQQPSRHSAAAAPPPPHSALHHLPPPPRPLLLTVRFSASIADLQLDIPRPGSTTVVALKHLIRSRLGAANARRRLRFIHGGKILPDTAVLSAVLRVPAPPPPASSSPAANAAAAIAAATITAAGLGNGPAALSKSAQQQQQQQPDPADPKGKGKAVEGREAAPQRVYVNCSIGDVLSDAELAAEKVLAERPAVPPTGPSATRAAGRIRSGEDEVGGSRTDGRVPAGGDSSSSSSSSSRRNISGEVRPTAAGRGAAATAATPRGFDRLLAAGFTAAEVNQLRLQFRSIHAARHTPDTMPSPDTLRSLEDAWIDNNNTGNSYASGGAAGSGGDDGGELGVAGSVADADAFGGMSGLLDVLLRGMAIGFLWPLASFGWLVREEGMWSRRWQVFVSLGCILSLTIGMIRSISGDG